MGLEDLAGAGIDHLFNGAKAKRRAAIRGIAMDGELDAVRRKRSLLDEDREKAITDPDSPHYRPPQQGERPSPRAQWDDARACWIEWDREANDWVEVPAAPAD